MGIESISLRVTILEGADLAAKDRNLMGEKTTSDPLVEIWLGDDQEQHVATTTTKHKTVNPVWNETFEIDNIRRPGPIKLKIYDADILSKKDAMGTVVIPFYALESSGSTAWYAVPPDSARNAQGRLQVRIEYSLEFFPALIRGNRLELNCRTSSNSGGGGSGGGGVENNPIELGLAWDMTKGLTRLTPIDMDVSCVAISETGQACLQNTVYYGNRCNSNNTVIHSGDERRGEKAGDDELIYMDLQHIPRTILAMYVILTVATPQERLSTVQSLLVTVRNSKSKECICSFQPSQNALSDDATAMILLRLARNNSDNNNKWILSPIQDTHPTARTFGSLIPHLKSYTRDLIPGIIVDPRERMAILVKGGNVRLTDHVKGRNLPKQLRLGLAWDVTFGINVDLDVSVICLDEHLNVVDTVFFNHLKSNDGAIHHHGDEREGDEGGDDETIDFYLHKTASRIKYMGIVINSFSGQELDDVSRASCHLFDAEHQELDVCSYALTNAPELNGYTALLVGCLYRVGRGKEDWCLQIISEAAQGRTVLDNVDELQAYLTKYPVQAPPEEEIEVVVETEMPSVEPVEEEQDIDLSNWT